ncbi:MAG: hypothetical protein AAF660_08505 [Pseudomonadota bacterium]
MANHKRMSSRRWALFRMIVLVFSLGAAYLLFAQGAFDSPWTFGGFLIFLGAFALAAAGIYRFVKHLDDPDKPLGSVDHQDHTIGPLR